METESSLPYSQEPAFSLCPAPYQFHAIIPLFGEPF